MDLLASLKKNTVGIQYAVRIFVGSTALWFLLNVLAAQNPIWAISSMVAVTDPQLQTARANFWARLANTAIGGIMGVLFLVVAGPRDWVVPTAMAATVLVSSYLIHFQTYWKIAPITAALVMASGLQKHSRLSGEQAALRRLGEVFLGSAMAVFVAFVFSAVSRWRINRRAP